MILFGAVTGGRDKAVFGALAAGVLVLCAAVYWHGLGGMFVFDSVQRVSRNPAIRIDAPSPRSIWRAAFSGQKLYPERGLAHVSFALDYHFSGGRFDVFRFKLTNLVIHLANGVLVLALCAVLVRRWPRGSPSLPPARRETLVRYVPLLACALWLLHPLQLTSVLYVVQRMTSLSAFFVFSGLLAFALGRNRLERAKPGGFALLTAGLLGGAGLGFLCKQNALLLPLLALTVELFFYDRTLLVPADRRRLVLLFVATVGLPVVTVLAIAVASPETLVGGYASRPFSLPERVLTQARVLLYYLRLIFVPNVGELGLYHDDFAASRGLLDPPSTVLSLLVWVVVVAAVARQWPSRPAWAFAVVWYLAGHAMESTILPLELVHEHRNYVPSFGVIAVTAYYLVAWAQGPGQRRRSAVLALAALLVAALAFATYNRSLAWRSADVLMVSLASRHPGSYRSIIGFAFNALPAEADVSLRYDAFRRAAALREDTVVPLIEMAKLVEAVDAYLRARGSDAAEPPAPASEGLSVLESALRADRDYLARLADALTREIATRLATMPLRTDTVVGLVRLVDCALSRQPDCVALAEPAARWHSTAIGNSRASPSDLAVLELSYAKLLADGGHEDAAVAHARRAGRLLPDSLYYRVQEAALYAAIDRWDEVGRVLAEIEQGPGRLGTGGEQLEAIERGYRRRAPRVPPRDAQ